ncbi:MAG TPA: ATP-grasp domain-containing protein [Candidatus Paceibacterota bacterium]
MARTTVGILRGGTSSEYNLSLKTGAAMMAALPEERYETRDILIDKNGVWYMRGTPVTPARALSQIDVALNALHGGVGEDGTVVRLLQRSGVPFAGARALPSAVALNKILAREILQKAGIRMPRAVIFSLKDNFDTTQMAKMVFDRFGPPYVVKPPSEGASHGILIAPHLQALPETIGNVLDEFGDAIVEEWVPGLEASVGVIENFRNQTLYALPPALVVLPQGARMLEKVHHEEGSLRHMVPSDFTQHEKRALMDAARAAHRALELAHFSRADFIVTPRHTYLLEVNTIPGLYPGASFPPMLEAVGSSVGDFLEHIIHLARQ